MKLSFFHGLFQEREGHQHDIQFWFGKAWLLEFIIGPGDKAGDRIIEPADKRWKKQLSSSNITGTGTFYSFHLMYCRYIFQIEINSGIHGQCFNNAKQNWQCYCESGIFEPAPYQGIKSNTIINYINTNINLINYIYL